MAKKYDFSGWATWNDALCADGRVIKHNAFKDNDGAIVPLVYMHGHKTPEDIIGNVLLENRDQGVYCYGSFNNNPQALAAREAVMHGDIDHLSIYANHLKHQNNNEVIHGDIKEVSLVISGANPGAVIDYIDLEHGEEGESAAIIFTDYVISNAPGEIQLTISHSDDEKKEEKTEEKKEESTEEPKTEEKTEEKKEEPKPEEKKEESKTEEKSEEKKEESTEESKVEEKTEEKKEEPKTEEKPVEHADMDEGKTIKDIYDAMSDEKKKAIEACVAIIVAQELGAEVDEDDVEHSDIKGSDKTIKEIFDTMTDDERKAAGYIMVETANKIIEEQKKNSNVEHSDIEGGNEMARNLFETNGEEQQENVLTHDDMVAILADIKTAGSLRNSVLQHGITNLEVMFPDDKYANDGTPIMVQRDQEWVSDVLNGVSKSPFARIKCVYADITGADARAKGFLGSSELHKDANGKPFRDSKGNLVDRNGNRVYKEEEVLPLIKRSVSPTTVYKKQRLDRNDIVDITDFDIVVWLKAEMKVMLNEEVARAILIGDGRSVSSPDKVDEACIKPIWTDDDFYTIKAAVTVEQTDTDDTVASKLIDMAVLAKKDYKGSGATVLYANEDYVTRMLLLKDTMGHRLYGTEAELASAMRVTKIISVPVFQGATRVDSDDKTRSLVGIIVNLKDYRVGTDKKGAVTMFDDFDIDYNQEKYLIETRMSGMMVMPKGAIALETVPAGNG